MRPRQGAFSGSQVLQWPLFYLKIGFCIGLIFAKCIIPMNLSFGLSTGCQKVLMHPNLHCKKH